MIQLIIILLIFLISLILILKNFEFSIYVLMVLSVLLHKELFSFYRWDLMPIRAFMLAILCAGVVRTYLYFIKNRSFKKLFVFFKDPVMLVLLILWLVRLSSLYFSLNLQASLLLFSFFTTVIFLAGFLYYRLKNTPEKVVKYLKFYSIVVFVLTLFGYVQVLLNRLTGVTIGALWTIPGNIPRVGATFWDVNHYGSLLAALLPVVGYLIIVEKGLYRRIFNILMFVSFVASLFLTNSRSAWIMASVEFLLFITILLIKRFGLKGILYIFLTILLISLPVAREYSIKSSPFRAKIKQYFHYRLDSFDSHFMLLTGALQIFQKYPVLGGGYGSFFEHFSKTPIATTYFGRDPAALNTRVPAHTIWGELLAETGILGLVVFLVFSSFLIYPPLFIALKSKIKEIYLMGAIIPSVIVGWFTAGIFYSYNSEFFWIVILIYGAWGIGQVRKENSVSEVFKYFFSSNRMLVTAIVILSMLLIFFGLGNNHLIPWDEAIYAKISKNMVVSNDYLVEYWNPGKVWYEKPPLYMWMMAGFMKLLGFNSLAARLPSAIFGFLLVLLTYYFGKKLFGKAVGFFSAFSLLTTVQFLYYSRASMLDVTTTFFITLALVLFYLAKQNKKIIFWIFSGISIGLGVMVKGVVGLLPFAVISVYELYLYLTSQQKFSKKLLASYISSLLFSLIIFVPWHLTMYLKFGQEFINNYIIYHVFDRAFSSIEDKGKPFWWYIVVLKVSMRIWFIALLAALPMGWIKAAKKDNKFVFLTLWAFIIFIFFSSAKSKLVWYITPIYPVLVLFVGYFVKTVVWKIIGMFKNQDQNLLKIISGVLIVVSSLFYLYLNSSLVYTSDLTGAQANLLQLKDTYFGVDKLIYIDRVERPLELFYTDGPFKEIDFSPIKEGRVPSVSYTEELVLLTKTGRFSETVLRYDYKPSVVSQEGDWILWYMKSRYQKDTDSLSSITSQINALYPELSKGSPLIISQYNELLVQKAKVEARIASKLK